jgi:hypothetical protein
MNQYQRLVMIVLAPLSFLCSTGLAVAAIQPGGDTTDSTLSIIYVSGTGEIAVDAAQMTLQAVQILSSREIFDGAGPALNLDGILDVNPIDDGRPDKIAKAVFGSSFGDISFGNVARQGLSQSLLLTDLTVTGALFPSGAFGPVGVDLVFVPESSSCVLFSLGMLFAPWVVNRRCRRIKCRHGSRRDLPSPAWARNFDSHAV